MWFRKINMDKKTTVVVIISIVVVGILIGGGLVSGLFTSSKGTTSTQSTTTMQQSDQIQVQDTAVGTGDMAVAGKTVTVNYTGYFTDGTVFDTSVGKAPFTFTLGSGMVIKGWDIGVEGMKVGGKRILMIPPEYAYGSNVITNPQTGKVIIPASSTLIFEVELLGVK
jgi:FKBP-type peptidyl-prolyl cis-trans isomerase